MTKQRHIPPTCPICGAALPHNNPMSREYHENVAHRSSEQEESLPGKEALWQRYSAVLRRYDELLHQFDMLEKRVTTLEGESTAESIIATSVIIGTGL